MERKFFQTQSPIALDDFLKKPNYEAVLEVHNFLTLKECIITRSKFTVLIGPQAEGKSIIAKLFYFCNYCIQYYQLAKNTETLKNEMTEFFSDIFPNILWKNKIFSITYSIDSYHIFIKNSKKFSIEFSDVLDRDMNITIAFYQRFIKKKNLDKENDFWILYDEIPYPMKFRELFITDKRQMFFLKDLNKFYLLKLEEKIYHDFSLSLICFNSLISSEYYNKNLQKRDNIFIDNYERLLNGIFNNEGETLYIRNKANINVPIELTSSGQQELSSLLMMLNTQDINNHDVYIEEPETHLFPTTQRDLIADLVAMTYRNNSTLFLTTHSPYILSALNIHIAASEVVGQTEDKVTAMQAIIPKDQWIPFSDIQCYVITGGKACNIMDKEAMMIDFSIIDACADNLTEQLNSVLHVLNGKSHE